MSLDYHVVVVGAGPAGSVAAREIASRGHRVLLLEEHGEVGAPVHCSGLVTSRTLEAAGVGEEVVVNRIRGAIVHSPLGRQVVVGGDHVRALVIDRRRFDELLAQQAQDANATLVRNARVTGAQVVEDGVAVTVERGGKTSTVKAELVIGADGSNSGVSRAFGLARPSEAVAAVGGEVAARALEQGMVEVFIDPDLAPGWFGWLIPLGDGGTARIGIGSVRRGHSPRRVLGSLLARHAHLRDGRILRLQGGLIPVAPPDRVTGPRAMLVGDAAGSVKPASGGGIYTGILSAHLAARTAVTALEAGPLVSRSLFDYERLWSVQVRRELLLGHSLRHLLSRLTPPQVDSLLGLLEIPDIQRMVREQGDIDFPARLFSRLFTLRPVLRVALGLPPGVWLRLLWLAWQWKTGTRAWLLGRNGHATLRPNEVYRARFPASYRGLW